MLSGWPRRPRGYLAAPRGVSRQGNEGVPCKFAETRMPTELGRARSSCYTELRSQITQFKILSVRRIVSRKERAGVAGYYCSSERGEERTSLNAKNQGHPWTVPGLLHQLRL